MLKQNDDISKIKLLILHKIDILKSIKIENTQN